MRTSSFESGSWLEAVEEILVGLLTGAFRSLYIAGSWIYVLVARPLAKAVGIQLADGKRKKISGGTLKAAAVGFSRTGSVRCPLSVVEP